MTRQPQGVRVEHADGTSTPVQLHYAGRHECDGTHHWLASVDVLRPGDQLVVAELPPRTTVELGWPASGS